MVESLGLKLGVGVYCNQIMGVLGCLPKKFEDRISSIFMFPCYPVRHSYTLIYQALIPFILQRVPALRVFWDLEKTVLHETRVSGTVLWSPTNAHSPTYMHISQKRW